MREREVVLAAPARSLCDDVVEPPACLALRARLDRTFAALFRRDEIVAFERLLRRARVERDRLRLCIAALEVLAEHHRLVLARALQPLAREAVPERAVLGREHLIRRVAH